MRRLFLACLIGITPLAAQEGPFTPPPELKAFALQYTMSRNTVSTKAANLLHGIFAPVSEGGLGMVYDNDHTRTVEEVWHDRKANCLSLTALFVVACRSVGLHARFAESLRTSQWRRVGTTIRFERHIVAVIPNGDLEQQLVADFLPELRRGSQMLVPLEDKRVLALFYSNRAVELLDGLQPAEAMMDAQRSIQVDPGSGVGWNILGVVQREQGQVREAEASFRKALQVDPKDGAACGNLELLLRAEGRDAEAQVYRDRSMEVRKHDPYFNAFLAEEALANQDYREAASRIRTAIRLLPQEPDFHLLQARLFLAQGKPKAALKSLEQARRWSSPEERARYDNKITLLKAQQE